MQCLETQDPFHSIMKFGLASIFKRPDTESNQDKKGAARLPTKKVFPHFIVL